MGKGPTEGILLAAGSSVRMGGLKQLAHLEGRPLLSWAIENALSSKLTRVVVVLGESASEIVRALERILSHPRVEVVLNACFQEGVGSSIRCGVRKLSPDSNSAMILLGDQPFVWPHVIDGLLDAFYRSDKEICVPFFQGKRGNPVVFGRVFFSELARLEGDFGGRLIVERNMENVLEVELGDPSVVIDVDTQEDLERAKGIIWKSKDR